MDPIYIYNLIHSKLRFKYEVMPLAKVATAFSGGTPSKDNEEYWEGDIPWASPKDFGTFYLSETKDHITNLGLQNSSSKIAPINSLLMVVRSGVLVHTLPIAINTVEMAINQDVKMFIPEKNILVEYLGYFFKVFNNPVLTRIVKHSTTVQSVNSYELERLPIPIPPIAIQQQIVSIMDTAYDVKKQKEEEAQRLSDTINVYLLDELGIDMPKEDDNTLENRLFYVTSSKVIGGRFDPFYYSPYYNNVFKAISLSQYPLHRLGDYITKISYGASTENCYVKEGIPLLRIKDLSPNEINIEDVVYLPKELENELRTSRVNTNDILITRSGTIGITAVVTDKFDDFAYGSFMIKFSTKDLDENYVSYVLNSDLGKIYFKRNKIGAIQGNITIPTIKNIEIPIPPLSKQNEIANIIKSIRNSAKQLEVDAKKAIDNAKKEVEKILLGE